MIKCVWMKSLPKTVEMFEKNGMGARTSCYPIQGEMGVGVSFHAPCVAPVYKQQEGEWEFLPQLRSDMIEASFKKTKAGVLICREGNIP